MSRRTDARGPSPRPNNIPTPPIRFAADETSDNKAQPSSKIGSPKIVAPKAIRAQPQYEDDDYLYMPRKASGGFIGWVVRTALRLVTYYALFAAVFTCGSGPLRFDYSTNDSRAVCRSLAFAKQQLVPLVTPLVHATHQRIDPYVGPYVRAAAPYAKTAYRIGKPHYDRAYKHGAGLYNKHVEPVRKHAVKRGHAYADPHVQRFRAEYRKTVQPHVDTLHKTVKPYRDIYARDVSPYVLQAQDIGVSTAKTSHKLYVQEAHPRLVAAFRYVRSFVVNHVIPAVRRAYVLLIRPQLDKLTGRVFGYMPDRTPKPAEYTERVKEAVSTAAASGKAGLSSVAESGQQSASSLASAASAEATAQKEYVVEQVESVKEAILPKKAAETAKKGKAEVVKELEPEAEEDDDEDDIGMEELDRQLDAELNYITKELESWERGMGRLIKDELNSHRKRLQSRGSETEAELHQARKASVAILRKFLREANKTFNKLMDAAKFERSVEDFQGWDKGMGVRIKLFIEDLDDLEREVTEAAAAEKAAAEAGVRATSEHGQSFVVQDTEQSTNVEDVAKGPSDDAEGDAHDATEPPSSVSGAFAEEPIPLPPAPSTDASNEGATSRAEDPTAAERDPAEPTFSILPTDDVTPPPSEDQPTFSILPIEVDEAGNAFTTRQTAEKSGSEPTFSIQPIKVDEAGNAFTARQTAAAGEPTFSILPIEVDEAGDAVTAQQTADPAAVDEPTFSIMPIDVVDEKGTPAKPIKHEEL